MGIPGGADDLAARLARATMPVRLVFFTQTFGCDTCLPARLAVDQIAQLSDKVTVEEHNLVLDTDKVAEFGVDHAPAVAVARGSAELAAPVEGAPTTADGDGDVGIRFYGVPSGYEGDALAEAVVRIATGGSGLTPSSLSAIAAVERPIHIRVFVTPTCRYCPQVVSLAYQMAAASRYITTTVIEATEFPDLARQYHVTGVPKTVVDDQVEILGAQTEDAFVSQVLQAGSEAAGG